MTVEKILPIGTIVYLKEGTQKLMILNRGATIKNNGEEVLFDYSGALYPVGLNPEQIFYFNQENIDKITFEGYNDDEEKRFIQLYEEWEKNEGSKLKKGNVSEFFGESDDKPEALETEEIIVNEDDPAGLFAGLHDGWD